MTQRTNIMGALEYGLEYLKKTKATLMDVGNKKQEENWAFCGLSVTLISHLIMVIDETIMDFSNPDKDAENDMLVIKEKFNTFVEELLSHE